MTIQTSRRRYRPLECGQEVLARWGPEWRQATVVRAGVVEHRRGYLVLVSGTGGKVIHCVRREIRLRRTQRLLRPAAYSTLRAAKAGGYEVQGRRGAEKGKPCGD